MKSTFSLIVLALVSITFFIGCGSNKQKAKEFKAEKTEKKSDRSEALPRTEKDPTRSDDVLSSEQTVKISVDEIQIPEIKVGSNQLGQEQNQEQETLPSMVGEKTEQEAAQSPAIILPQSKPKGSPEPMVPPSSELEPVNVSTETKTIPEDEKPAISATTIQPEAEQNPQPVKEEVSVTEVTTPSEKPSNPDSEFVLYDDLTDKDSRSVRVRGGEFREDGWKKGPIPNNDKIVYKLCAPITKGYVEVEVKGLKPSRQALDPKKQYFIGLYDQLHGDKKPEAADGSKQEGAVYYELRYNAKGYSGDSKYENKIKFDHGNWNHAPPGSKNGHERYEPQTPAYNWDPNRYYRFKIEIDGKAAKVYIDDQLVIQNAGIKQTPVTGMRYVYIGDVGYGGEDHHNWIGPPEFTFKSIKVKGNADCSDSD